MPPSYIDKYLAELSTDTLMPSLILSSVNHNDSSVAGQRNASKQQLFDKHAITSTHNDEKVWTRTVLGTFLSQQGFHDEALVDVVWRCLYFTSRAPLADPVAVSPVQEVDLTGFIRATRSHAYTIHRRGHEEGAHSRNKLWDQYFSMSAPAARPSESDDEDTWTPPDKLERISYKIQATLRRPKIMPNLERIRVRAQEVFGPCTPTRTGDYQIDYSEMVALIAAIMRLVKDPSDEARHSFRRSTYTPRLANEDDEETRDAIAHALLDAGGISAGNPVSFAALQKFSKLFTISDDGIWQFDQEIDDLWSALFDEVPTRSASRHPPCYLLQALRFVSPSYDLEQHPDERLKSKLAFHTNEADDKREIQTMLMLFQQLFYARTVLIRGRLVQSSADGAANETSQPKPGVIIVITASPNLDEISDRIRDRSVGEQHYLIELAPRVRVMRFTKSGISYDDLVQITENKISIGATASGHASGLTIHLADEAGSFATLWSDGSQQGYEQVCIGPTEGLPKPVDKTSPFRTTIHISEIGIYDLPGYGPEDRAHIQRPISPE